MTASICHVKRLRLTSGTVLIGLHVCYLSMFLSFLFFAHNFAKSCISKYPFICVSYSPNCVGSLESQSIGTYPMCFVRLESLKVKRLTYNYIWCGSKESSGVLSLKLQQLLKVIKMMSILNSLVRDFYIIL